MIYYFIIWLIGLTLTVYFQYRCGIWKKAWPSKRQSDRAYVQRRRTETLWTILITLLWPIYLSLVVYHLVRR